MEWVISLLIAALVSGAAGAPRVLFDEEDAVTLEVRARAEIEDYAVEVVTADGDVRPAHGERMLRLRGRAAEGGQNAHLYLSLGPLEYPVTERTVLAYDVYVAPNSADDGFGVDLCLPNFYPDNLRDFRPAVVDQNGLPAHPAYAPLGALARGRWYRREFSLAPCAGRTATAALVAWDSMVNGRGGKFAAYFDRIELREAAEGETASGPALPERFDEVGPTNRSLRRWRPLPPVAPRSPEEWREKVRERGFVRRLLNGRLGFENGEAFLPWGLFGSEIYYQLPDVADALDARAGDQFWWSWVEPSEGPKIWTEDDWRRYFATCERLGINALRLFSYGYHVKPGERNYFFDLDAVGRAHPTLWRKLERFIEVGSEYGIYFLITLVASPDHVPYTGPEKIENARREYTEAELARLSPAQRRFLLDGKVVPIQGAFDAPEFFADADMAACIEQYLADLLPRLADNPRIFALEIMNEALPPSQAEWARDHVAQVVRRLAPRHLLVHSQTSGGEVLYHEALTFERTVGLDLYSWHQYMPQNTPCAVATDLNCKWYHRGVPALPGEGPSYYGGTPREQVNTEVRRRQIRDYLWFPLVNNLPGAILWTPENPALDAWEWRELDLFHRTLRRIERHVDFAPLHRRRPQMGISTQDWAPAVAKVYGRYCLEWGYDYDFTAEPDAYELPIHTADGFRPVHPTDRPLVASLGYWMRYLAGDRTGAVVAYLVHSADGERVARTLRGAVALHLPPGRYRFEAVDLDQAQFAELTVDGTDRIELAAETTSDFVVIVSPVPKA